MAATGFTPISLYYSTTASTAPTSGNLVNGELAINITDGKLYYKDNAGVVQTIASKAGNVNVSSISFGTTGLTPNTATTGAVTVAGTLVVSNGGTGQTTLATGSLGYGQGTSAHAALAIGTAGQVLTVNSGATAPQWVNASSIIGGAGGSNTQVQYNSSGLLAGSANMTFDGTTLTTAGLSDSGNLTFTGTGNRITGDFSNGTITNRILLQTSTTNGSTYIGAMTNGSGTDASYRAYTSSDPLNSSYIDILASSANSLTYIRSGITGTGAYLPLTMWTSGSERLRIDTNGLVGIGLTPSGTTVKLQVSSDALISGLTVGKGGGALAQNNAFGSGALNANTSGNYNTGGGYTALYQNTTGSFSSAVGYGALFANTTGNSNSAFGFQALQANTTGGSNTAVGYQALDSNTTASNNTAVGYQASYSGTTGYNNTAVGNQSLYSVTTGYNNTAVGALALNKHTSDINNTAVGYASMYNNTTGGSNSSFGSSAFYANTTGNYNVALGSQALYSNTTASQNTTIIIIIIIIIICKTHNETFTILEKKYKAISHEPRIYRLSDLMTSTAARCYCHCPNKWGAQRLSSQSAAPRMTSHCENDAMMMMKW